MWKRRIQVIHAATLCAALCSSLAVASPPAAQVRTIKILGVLVGPDSTPVEAAGVGAYPHDGKGVVFKVGEDGRVQSFDAKTDAGGRFTIVVDRNRAGFDGDLALCVRVSTTSLEVVQARSGGVAVFRFNAGATALDVGRIVVEDGKPRWNRDR